MIDLTPKPAILPPEVILACNQIGMNPLRIQPGLSPTEIRLLLSSFIIKKAMRNKEFCDHIMALRSEYLHNKGWSQNKTLKSEYIIPQAALLMLPVEMRKDRKALKKWLRENHPYLYLNAV